jgi:hypothetical protein
MNFSFPLLSGCQKFLDIMVEELKDELFQEFGVDNIGLIYTFIKLMYSIALEGVLNSSRQYMNLRFIRPEVLISFILQL